MSVKEQERSSAVEYRCLDGPLDGVTICGTAGDGRPVWYAPTPRLPGRKYILRRAARVEQLPSDMRWSATGCYVESTVERNLLMWLAWPGEDR